VAEVVKFRTLIDDLGNVEFKEISYDYDFTYLQSTNSSLVEYLKNNACFRHLMSFENTKLIIYDNKVIGYFTMEFQTVCIPEESDNEIYPSVSLKYLVVDKRYEGNGIGTEVLRQVAQRSGSLSKFVGCRCLFIKALTEKIDWYEDRGFQLIDENRNTNTLEYKDTIEMFMDFRDQNKLDEYLEP